MNIQTIIVDEMPYLETCRRSDCPFVTLKEIGIKHITDKEKTNDRF